MRDWMDLNGDAGDFEDETMGGAILFSMIAGIACIVYNIENREE